MHCGIKCTKIVDLHHRLPGIYSEKFSDAKTLYTDALEHFLGSKSHGQMHSESGPNVYRQELDDSLNKRA